MSSSGNSRERRPQKRNGPQSRNNSQTNKKNSNNRSPKNQNSKGSSSIDRRRRERENEPKVDRRRRDPYNAGPSSWGGVARRGAGWLEVTEKIESPERTRNTAYARPEPTYEDRRAKAIEEKQTRDKVRYEAGAAVNRAKKRTHRSAVVKRSFLPASPRKLPDAETSLVRILGNQDGRRALRRLLEASQAFEQERFFEARKILIPLERQAPGVVEIAEISGLTLYRLGRWREAAKKLEKVREISGGTEQNPVLADCYRALEWWVDVEELWDELRDASPSGSLVTEGRIVAAGALADQGKVSAAINLLERGWRFPKRAKDYHLRRVYTLADLYERSGTIPKARDLFVWIKHQDKNYGDVASRIEALQ